MSFGAMRSLSEVLPGDTTLSVHTVGNGLKMCRIATGLHPTKMVWF